MGFTQVYDYVDGKVDWMAAGWPTEGTNAQLPRAGDIARRDAPTCKLDEQLGDVQTRVSTAGWDACVVVNDERVVLGLLRRRELGGETAERHFNDADSDGTVPRTGRYVCISVSDSGSGFTDEARKHAFEPFFTTKPVGRGTGLGLATVHGIATDAGGHAALYSEAGMGTTVRVYLPALDGEFVAAAAASGSILLDGEGSAVLLVEDEPQLRLVTARMLERHAYRVYAVETPQEALTLLKSATAVNLLLTDVVMPGMSGPQLAERAVSLRPALRLLYMSGFPRDLWERGEIDPELLLLEKPFDAEQLLRKVSAALHASRRDVT
jgi:CheY-like chemotaxis protein